MFADWFPQALYFVEKKMSGQKAWHHCCLFPRLKQQSDPRGTEPLLAPTHERVNQALHPESAFLSSLRGTNNQGYADHGGKYGTQT